MLKKSSVAFIGGGRVARILLAGWKLAGRMPARVVVVEPDEHALDLLLEVAPEAGVAEPGEIGDCALVFLAVHPPMMKEVLESFAGEVGPDSVVVSLVPRFKCVAISEALGTPRLVRMIPNAPSAIGAGYNPVFFSEAIERQTKEWLVTLFAPWGEQPEVAEGDLEAYAVITAMGPTYFWYQIQALRELAVSFGLTREASDAAVSKMLSGAVSCLLAKGPDSMDLIPVRPLQDLETTVKEAYEGKLRSMFSKLTA